MLALHSQHANGGCCKVKGGPPVFQQAAAGATKVVGAVASAVSQPPKVSVDGSLSVGVSNDGITASGSLSASGSILGKSFKCAARRKGRMHHL